MGKMHVLSLMLSLRMSQYLFDKVYLLHSQTYWKYKYNLNIGHVFLRQESSVLFCKADSFTSQIFVFCDSSSEGSSAGE